MASLLVLVYALAIFTLFFILIRSIVLWYFRIGEQRRMERERNELLKIILVKLRSIDEELGEMREENASKNTNEVQKTAQEKQKG